MISTQATPMPETDQSYDRLYGKPEFTFREVNPEMAKRWLEHNESNRAIRPARVKQYAEDMRAGEWRMTGEAIKFDRFGHLLDGQHRLTAIIESDTAVHLPIVTGVEPRAREVMDTGAARTASDALRMNGEAIPAVLGAAAKIGVLIEAGAHLSNRVTNAQVLRYVDERPGLRTAAIDANRLFSRLDIRQSVMAYAKFRTDRIDAFASNEFWESLASLSNLGPDSPILRLAHRLRQAQRNAEKVDNRVLLVTIFRTWNQWRDGKSVSKVQFAADDAAFPALR